VCNAPFAYACVYAGCYIGKVSYYREGEPSLDMFYRPYHLVEYYRYVRFFPSGKSDFVLSGSVLFIIAMWLK
jgi:hypothetical protein